MTIIMGYGHLAQITVHFDDLDPMGFVHNARYPVLVERALGDYWRQFGYTFSASGPSHPDVVHAVREFSIEYLQPIRGTGQVGVHLWVQRLGDTSLSYGFRFVSGNANDTEHARGSRVIVKIDPATLRPAPWSDETRHIASGLLADPARV